MKPGKEKKNFIKKTPTFNEKLNIKSPMMEIKNAFEPISGSNSNIINIERKPFIINSFHSNDSEDYKNHQTDLFSNEKYNRNYPSKDQVCKGDMNQFGSSKAQQMSPICNYFYPKGNGEKFMGGELGTPLESPLFMKYSPSQIFNKDANLNGNKITKQDNGGTEENDNNTIFKLPNSNIGNFEDTNFYTNLIDDQNGEIKGNEIKQSNILPIKGVMEKLIGKNPDINNKNNIVQENKINEKNAINELNQNFLSFNIINDDNSSDDENNNRKFKGKKSKEDNNINKPNIKNNSYINEQNQIYMNNNNYYGMPMPNNSIPFFYQNNLLFPNPFIANNNNFYNQPNMNNYQYQNFYNRNNIPNNIIYNNPQNIMNLNPNKYNVNKNIVPNFMKENRSNISIQNNYFMYQDQAGKNNKDNTKKIENLETNNKTKKKKKKGHKILNAKDYKDKPLQYYGEKFVELAKDQGASRHLQLLLDKNPKEIIDVVFKPLCKNAIKLINDPFGNYLTQKIITNLTEEQNFEFIKQISLSIYEIACNPHGTRVLQTLIEKLTNEQLKEYFFELIHPRVIQLLKNVNGTYIIQKFVSKYMNDYGKRINQVIIEHSAELCTNRHGCCVIQKYIETNDPSMLPELIEKLIENSLPLIVDQFGNYVIQTILLINNNIYGNKLVEKILPQIVYYSKHKYSSNVVEKCFDHCDNEYKKKLMSSVQQKDNLVNLILDEHGNYIVQKVLSLENSNGQISMLEIIKESFDKLKDLPYGGKIISRIMATYPIIKNL